MSVTTPWHECRYVVVLTVKHSKYLTTMENTLKATIKKKKRYLIGYLMVILLWALTRRLCVCEC